MAELGVHYHIVILIMGVIISLAVMIKAGLEKVGLPALIGYLALGFAIRIADDQFNLLTPEGDNILAFMAKLGVFVLLFRVGLESNIRGLLKQFRKASVLWCSNVLVSGATGFVTAFYLLALPLVTSIIVATALTATSVGVSLAVWEEFGALNSKNGQLLVDVAEMDDISAVVFMAMVFTIIGTLNGAPQAAFLTTTLKLTLFFVLKMTLFGIFCVLFSRFLEPLITGYFRNLKAGPDPMLVVVAVGFIIAAFAALLGFSVAIGAFFAGLVFSRDPNAVKTEASFLPLYEFFCPFFFIGIGISMDPGAMKTAFGLGTALLAAAILGKLLANVVPLWRMIGLPGGLLIGASMVPRAEISMIIMDKGLKAGNWAMAPEVFGAMVIVTAGTCILSPSVVSTLLKRWPQQGEDS
ncbi:MAG: cation:proton antiporter [Desulfatiglandaceae bacterium]